MQIVCHPPGEFDKTRSEPELLMINRRHMWIDGEHYVRSDDRRAVPGKYYLVMNHELLVRVTGVTEAEESVTDYGVEDAEDTITYERLYSFPNPGSVETESGEGSMQRYQMESAQAISMGDVGSIPFEKFKEE